MKFYKYMYVIHRIILFIIFIIIIFRKVQCNNDDIKLMLQI